MGTMPLSREKGERLRMLFSDLASGNEAVREQARDTILAWRDLDIYEHLLASLHSDNLFVLNSALLAIKPFRRTRAKKRLIELLSHPLADIRIGALRVFFVFKDKHVLSRMLDVSENDPDAEVRAVALQCSAYGDIETLYPYWLRALHGGTSIERVRVCQLMAQKRLTDGITDLIDVTHCEEVAVQEAALLALGALRAYSSLDAINRCIRSEHAAVRRACATALGEIARPACVPLFEILLRDPDPEVRKLSMRMARRIVRL